MWCLIVLGTNESTLHLKEHQFAVSQRFYHCVQLPGISLHMVYCPSPDCLLCQACAEALVLLTC